MHWPVCACRIKHSAMCRLSVSTKCTCTCSHLHLENNKLWHRSKLFLFWHFCNLIVYRFPLFLVVARGGNVIVGIAVRFQRRCRCSGLLVVAVVVCRCLLIPLLNYGLDIVEAIAWPFLLSPCVRTCVCACVCTCVCVHVCDWQLSTWRIKT